MTAPQTVKSYSTDTAALPSRYPTHGHEPEFWEALGRTVATFGFLEEMLAKAIYALTGTQPAPVHDRERAFEAWTKTLDAALTGSLGMLIKEYNKALNKCAQVSGQDEKDLTERLREAAEVRNVLAHGSWGSPDHDGASLPWFVSRKLGVFETRVNVAFLEQLQRHVCELACAVINSVTLRGWQFPGSNGPGKPVSG